VQIASVISITLLVLGTEDKKNWVLIATSCPSTVGLSTKTLLLVSAILLAEDQALMDGVQAASSMVMSSPRLVVDVKRLQWVH
jgi:hypothetical protein